MRHCFLPTLVVVTATLFALPRPTLATAAASGELASAVAGNGSPDPTLDAACSLAIGTPKTTAFIWTPPEELSAMYWKIPTCASCGAAGITAKSLSFRLRWLGPCSAQATVLVVGAKQGAACVEPDTTVVLCPPATYTISSTVNTIIPYTLAFTPGSCFTGTAFAVVRFKGLGACGTNPSPGLIASTANCRSCDQFVQAKNVFPDITEWCSIGASTETWFSIDVDCCTVTPTRSHSWGNMKTRYR